MRSKSLKRWIVLLLTLLILAVSIYILSGFMDLEGDRTAADRSGYRDNYTLHHDAGQQTADDSAGEAVPVSGAMQLRDRLNQYISSLDGVYGLYCINLENGMEFGINGEETFFAASTIKIPLNLYACRLMEKGMLDPDMAVEYTMDDYEEGTGSIRYKEFGSEYTLRELCRLSITLSDNVAANMLLRVVGRMNMKEYMRSVGGRVVDDNENTSSPADMALFLKEVYEFSRKSTYGKELLDNLQKTVFNDRIPAMLPEGIHVAHKIGNWQSQYHDAGIVFTSEPYVISVMTKDVMRQDAFAAIAVISRMVFDFFS